MPSRETRTPVSSLTDFADRLIRNIETVIVGKRAQIEMLLVALLCQGHVLIEDVPGTGKTMLARAAAASLGLQFKRVQCTPDLLPNDITGVSVFNQQTQSFDFRPGPVFVNILLADEINRATPREYERTLATHLSEAQAETDQLREIKGITGQREDGLSLRFAPGVVRFARSCSRMKLSAASSSGARTAAATDKPERDPKTTARPAPW